MNKKYQVFISSTYTDLIEERKKIVNILLMADCIPSGMESFVATDNEQFEVIKKIIELCDYYMLIIGKRYGSINDETGKSYTEMEYLYAKEKGIPVLVFVLDEAIKVDPAKEEQDPSSIVALRNFKQEALNNRLGCMWTTIDDLVGKVALSIMTAKNEIKRLGWQRATEYNEGDLRRQIMDLQEENNSLVDKIEEMTKTNVNCDNVEFNDYVINIKYKYKSYQNQYYTKESEVNLKEFFIVLSLNMLDVAINEDVIKGVLIKYCSSNNSSALLVDDNQMKVILNQLKEGGFITSKWSDSSKKLFWKLTKKGKQMRFDLTIKKIITEK